MRSRLQNKEVKATIRSLKLSSAPCRTWVSPNRDMINFQLVKEGISNANTYCHVSVHTLQQYR